MKEKNIISNFNKQGDPNIKKFIDKNVKIVEAIHKALEEKGMTKEELSQLINKEEKELNKMLTGTYNIDLKTITTIEEKLGITIINVSS